MTSEPLSYVQNSGVRYEGFTAEEFARSRVSFHQTMVRRFERRLAANWRREDDCHIWTGRLGTNGYGLLVVPGTSRTTYVHRYIWEQANGPVPVGLELLHSCDRPPCGRLAHLRLGTHAENVADMLAKGRRNPLSHRRLWVDAIRAIRDSSVSDAEIAAEYGVQARTIRDIRRGRTWTNA